jgi:antirestriction protein ArdC
MSAHLRSQAASSVVERPTPSTRSVYERVTSTIIAALEAGVVPWRKPWADVSPPCNAVTKRPYHGINFLLLGLSRFEDHRWLTYRQAQELGGHVRAGEQSSPVVFWKKWEVENSDPASGAMRLDHVPILRYYHVFNAGQCDEIDLAPLDHQAKPENERIAAAERLVQNMPDPPRIHEGCRQACYYPLVDVVQMPSLSSFDSADAYYATLFHELAHATGHEKRLNRRGVTTTAKFGSGDYSREELVAEFASAFCASTVGLDNRLTDNAASYIDGWLHPLRSDPRAVVIAAGQAQRAADFICQTTPPDVADAGVTEGDQDR